MALEDFTRKIVPQRTVLLLGAGASVPSGAPTGRELAIAVSNEIRGRVVSEDLVELATILQRTDGRAAVIGAVRTQLKSLKPTGGLLALPEFDWRAIYTTNFDRLVEKAYRCVGREVVLVRSNYDYARLEADTATPLLKLHGCISKDIVDGDKARLVLTEEDYLEYRDYRQMLFARLGIDLMGHDVLVIGQSLTDPHLQSAMREAADAKRNAGAPGRLSALVYEQDEDRAVLWESRGFEVAFGGIDELLRSLVETQPERPDPVDSTTRLRLKPILGTAAIDIDHSRTLKPDALRMFNGRAATYADIARGMTFDRSARVQLQGKLHDPTVQFLVVIGAAGVGKTTLARQLLSREVGDGVYCWEHVFDYPLSADEWIGVDAQLRERDARGVLLVDNCGAFLGAVNRIASRLAATEDPRLKLVLTARPAAWRTRLKDRSLHARGSTFELSRLTDDDVASLARLAADTEAISKLVDPTFAALPRVAQEHRLRRKARADMYVCLKNMFANEQLDNILLQEYAELDEGERDIYRLVSALEAMGSRVHRQLVLRLVDVESSAIHDLLRRLEGTVDEYTISAPRGLYGWATRHELIAQTIARYKFSGQEELKELLHQVVDALNPAEYLELRSMREMCNSDFGVPSVKNPDDQLELFQKMVAKAPAERVPRHRVIRKLLELDRLDAAAQEIRLAEEAMGASDRPIERYKVRLTLLRARNTPGLEPEDRLAILRQAEGKALEIVNRYPTDFHTYNSYAQVGIAMAELAGDLSVLDHAIELMAGAYEEILDPEMGDALARLERTRRDLASRLAKTSSAA